MAVKNEKAPWYYLRRSDGEPSLSATLVLVSFWVTTAVFVSAAFKKIGPIEFREFDVAAVSSYLIPILTNYLGRRWIEAKETPKSKPPKTEPIKPDDVQNVERTGGD